MKSDGVGAACCVGAACSVGASTGGVGASTGGVGATPGRPLHFHRWLKIRINRHIHVKKFAYLRNVRLLA